jgi:hypothetical protein
MTMTAVLLAALLLLLQSACSPGAPMGEEARESFEVWICPEHTDEQAAGPADCPICRRDMVRRFLVSSYSCPMHPDIDREEPGACPICSMDLRAVTRELQWYCPDHPTEVSSVPGGLCSASGKPMAVRSIPMAHGDHNPRHGGILFMAPDGLYHLEGVLSHEGEFRLYFYDERTEPIEANGFPARIGSHHLEPTEHNAYLTATLDPPEDYPAEVVLHVRFPRTEDESRFDFLFVENMGDGVTQIR